MNACVDLIEPQITELKGEKFVLVFDGVTDNGEHSLAVFVVTRKGWRFLALSSFLDEHSMTADEHIRFFDPILDQYQLDISNIVGIVCDNMETNKAISRRVCAPMIGCAAHRFHLAVKAHLRSYTDTIKKVYVLMRKLKSVKRIALLKANGCKLKPVPMHELRWSGIHRMLKRYKQLQPFLHLFERDCDVDRFIPEDAPEDDSRRFPIVQYLPNPAEHCFILELLDDMEHKIFWTDLEDRLGVDASIVESPAFEAGVVKIMKGYENQLTQEEVVAVARLQRTPAEEFIPLACSGSSAASSSKRKRNKNQSSSSTASKKKRNNTSTLGDSVSSGLHGQLYSSSETESVPRHRRSPEEVKLAIAERAKTREEDRSKHMDLSWLPATSVEVERLFSAVKCMLGYLRKQMSAKTLEAILYLRMNWDLVTNEVTSRAVQTACEEDEIDDEDYDSYE